MFSLDENVVSAGSGPSR